MSDENRMTDLQQYLAYKNVLLRPTFDSEDDARANMRAKDGEFRRFIIRDSRGTYRVCFCFLSQPRGSDELQWAFNDEYTFTIAQMNVVKDRAALAIGTDLVESME